jgi:PD-(D/E)XK nuclease superfamily
MSELFQFSQSKVKKWRQCRLAYHYRYVDGLKKKTKSRPLQFGTMVHEMLEADANGDCPFEKLDELAKTDKKLFAVEKEMYGEIVEDIRLIMTAYFQYYAKDKMKYIRYKKQNAEHWIEVPVDGDMLFVLKIDGLTRTPNKLRWVMDHKTFKKRPSEDARWRDLQSAVYLKACEKVGMKPFDGFVWNYVHSKPPTIPQILKSNGNLSTRAINTLPSVVNRMIEELNLDPDDHKGLIAGADNNVKNYFFRVFTPINTTIVNIMYEEFIDTAREMKDYHGLKKDRNIGMHCGWSCDFEPLCRASLTGGDVDFIKEREYESREERKGKKESGKESKGKGKRKSRRKG